ncbi:universal stress protein [Natrialba chahannaoensis]|nr:universal stress protein [Natrialba chahannaoensis]
MTRHVLVPMDDSEPARAAFEHALTIYPESEITVVHVVDDLETGYAGESAPADADEAEPEFFTEVRELATTRDHSVKTVVIEGTSAEAILEFADEEEADQIVMGSAGRSGVSRMLLGSIAEGVARRSTIPVTIVPRAVTAHGDSNSTERQ